MISELLFKPSVIAAVDHMNARSGWSGIFGTGGRTKSGQTVSPQRAMQSAAVYTCVSFLAKIMASLPLEIAERTSNGITSPEHPIGNLLKFKPNAEMTIYDFLSVSMGHLALCGNSYAEIVYDRQGNVAEIYPIHPDQVRLEHVDGELVYFVRTNSGQVPLLKENVIHVKWFSNDGIRGISPLQHASEVVGHGMALQDYGSSLFANDGTPPLMIEVPVGLDDASMDNARELLTSFQNRGTGDKRHRVGMLLPGMKMHQISISNEQAQFLESRQYTDRLIAAIFGVPSVYLNDAVKDTFGVSKEADLRKYTLGPLAYNIELEFTTKLFPNSAIYTKFNFASLLRADPETRSKIRTADIGSGVISLNEAREDEGRNAVVGLDIFQNTKQSETIGPDAEVELPEITTSEDTPTFDIHSTYQPLLTDALDRVLTKEIKQVKSALKKNAGDVEGFKCWLENHYNDDHKTQADIRKAIEPIITSSEKLGINLIPEKFSMQYVGSSKGQLAAVIRKTSNLEAINECLVDWEENRVAEITSSLLEDTEITETSEPTSTVNVTVNMPDQQFSVGAARAPNVTVNVPEHEAPTINVLPSEAKIDNNITVQPIIQVDGDVDVETAD